MKKLLSFLLCLSLSFFTVARATKSGYAENKSLDMSDAEQEEVTAEEDSNAGAASADDDEGEDMNNDDGRAGDAGHENVLDDDGGNDAERMMEATMAVATKAK